MGSSEWTFINCGLIEAEIFFLIDYSIRNQVHELANLHTFHGLKCLNIQIIEVQWLYAQISETYRYLISV
jgi:hypothetical protein